MNSNKNISKEFSDTGFKNILENMNVNRHNKFRKPNAYDIGDDLELSPVYPDNNVTWNRSYNFNENLSNVVYSRCFSNNKRDETILKHSDIFLPNHITTYKIKPQTKILDISCFDSCTKLKEIVVPNNITKIEKSCFRECMNLTNISLPTSIEQISDNCFNYCGLKSIVLPNSIVEIGKASFAACFKLKSIELSSNLIIIDDNAFYTCGLDSIVIPDSVKYIGDNCFRGCTKLTSLVLPSTIEYLGDNCFKDCDNLKKIENNSIYEIEI